MMPRIGLVLVGFALAGCSAVTPDSGGRVGTDGWVERRTIPGELIRVERPGGDVEIGPYGAGTYYVRYHYPIGNVFVPEYPGSRREDVQKRPIWENRIYRLDDDATTFREVYDWYIEWFDFRAPEGRR
jgi:hypothetical protein